MKKTILFLFACLAMISCSKKDNAAVVASKKELIIQDLLDYYIVVEWGGKIKGDKINVFSFAPENPVFMVKDSKTYNVGAEVTLKNDTLVFDLTDESMGVYSFVFEKKTDNSVSLKSVSYGDKTISATHFVLAKTKSLENFADKTLKQTDNANSYLKFTADKKWGWNTTKEFTVAQMNRTYTSVGTAHAWKGAAPDGSKEHIGVMVPQWKNINSECMVVENFSAIAVFTKM